MTLLAATLYDPQGGAAVNKVTTGLLPMTAFDTTNLRLNFNVPANGAVKVRLRCVLHGATTMPQVHLGVLEGATIKGRVTPRVFVKSTATATMQSVLEATFVVPGLTPGANLNWDAAYAVDIVAAATGLKYGGPNNTTTNDAFGGFLFEIHDTAGLLGAKLYDPTGAGSLVTSKVLTSLLAMTRLDTSNTQIIFTATSTAAYVRLFGTVMRGFPIAMIELGVIDSGNAVVGRMSPMGGVMDTTGVANREAQEVSFPVMGLTPGTTYTWDYAYGVEIVGAAGSILGYGGPDDSTTDNSAGAVGFEIWDPMVAANSSFLAMF